jgi:peroxiredoxin Q/BCP
LHPKKGTLHRKLENKFVCLLLPSKHSPMATTLQEGQKAPDFTGKDQDGNTVSLHDFQGKKIVLYFYPKDDTPGCTAQACNLRDNYTALIKSGYVVIGVSADDVKSHKKFEQKFNLPFPLIADEDQKIVNEYGVWGEKQMFGKKYMGIIRTTFLIDENGDIKSIINKPDTENHTQQVFEAWNA